jgi:hypothetical protein
MGCGRMKEDAAGDQAPARDAFNGMEAGAGSARLGITRGQG